VAYWHLDAVGWRAAATALKCCLSAVSGNASNAKQSKAKEVFRQGRRP